MEKFAFLIHARDVSDMSRKFPGARYLPDWLIEGVTKRLGGRIGFTTCSNFDVYGKAEGYLVGIILTSKQIVTLPRELVHQRILEAILFTQDKLGAKLIGLGALTTSATDGGKWIAQHPNVRAKITHGDAYVVAVAEEDIEKLMGACGFKRGKAKIAIVGAYGVVGEALAKVLALKGHQLILIGRNETKLEGLREGLKSKNNILTSTELSEMQKAEIVVTTTSHPGALLKSEHLSQGAVVYDIAQPINASPKLVKERPDIIRVDGAYVGIKGIDLGFNMGPPPGTTFGCVAGTIIEALEGENNHYVGEINLAHVEETKRWAEKYGFSPIPFSCFGKPIALERFQESLGARK